MPSTVAAQLAALTALVEHIDRRAEEDRQERKDSQAETELARRATSAELSDIRHAQSNVLERLSKIEPVTDLVTSVRARITGGLMLLGVLGGIAWGGVVFFKDIIMEWFT